MFKFDPHNYEYDSTPLLEVTERQINHQFSSRDNFTSQPRHITLPPTAIHWHSEGKSFHRNNIQYHPSTELTVETTVRRELRNRLIANEREIFNCAV